MGRGEYNVALSREGLPPLVKWKGVALYISSGLLLSLLDDP